MAHSEADRNPLRVGKGAIPALLPERAPHVGESRQMIAGDLYEETETH